MRHLLLRWVVGACAAASIFARAESDSDIALLREAASNWSAGKQDLSFTQRGKTFYDDGRVREERVERYDPSLPDAERWHLITVNGQPPTEEQRQAIEVKRNRKPRKKALKPPEELLDFPRTKIVESTPKDVTFEVPLRPGAARLVQTEKLLLLVTVDRENRTIERVTATLREPMRVALGLARITDVDFDLVPEAGDETTNPTEGGKGQHPPDEQLTGTARIALTKLGEKMEYEWFDFRRVDAYRSGRSTASAGGASK